MTTTQPILRSPARCESCHKVYRVPHPERTYRCKACGGAVRGHPESAQEAAHESTAELRFEANEALKRGYRWITGVTWIYRLGALAYATVTVFAVLALARPEIPLGPGKLVIGLTTLLTVLMILGALHILFRPFVWTLIIASLATVVTVVHLVGPNPLGLMAFCTAVWAAVLWAALVPTLRFQRLIAEHKDLYILHHASVQTRRSIKGRSPEARHERLLQAMQRAARRAWGVSALAIAAVVAASGAGTYAVVHGARPSEREPTIAAFEAAWNAQGLEGITPFLHPQARDRAVQRLAGIATGFRWGDTLPPLEPHGTRQEGDDTLVDYEVGGEPVTAVWGLHGLEWVVRRLDLPQPPVDTAFETFEAAWAASSPERIAELIVADYRPDMLATMRRSIELRGWESLPPILSSQREEDDDPLEEVILLTLEDGVLATKWRYQPDGTWSLHGMKFPKRKR